MLLKINPMFELFFDRMEASGCTAGYHPPMTAGLCALSGSAHALLTQKKPHEALQAMGDLLAASCCLEQTIRLHRPNVPKAFTDANAWDQDDACSPYDIAESVLCIGKRLADPDDWHLVRPQLSRILSAIKSLTERHPLSVDSLLRLRLMYDSVLGPLPAEAVYYHPQALANIPHARSVALTWVDHDLPADTRAEMELAHGTDRILHLPISDRKTQHSPLIAWFIE